MGDRRQGAAGHRASTASASSPPATWDANRNDFGILPEIWGTLYSSLLALLIGGFFGVTVAIFLTQDFLPPRLARVFRTIVELLAAIPSVVYGLWGIFVVIPAIRPVADWLHETLGWIPVLRHLAQRPGHAAGGARAGDHGAADGRRALARTRLRRCPTR